ncbi:MAG: ABC transporter permease, partial [Cyclobacteriaceae bacterium]
MIKNLLKVAFRNVKKEKFFSLLNILGLTIGTICILFISLYITDELSYDKFHQQADRIYRINQTFIWGDDDNLFGSTGPAVADALRTEIPEFDHVTRVHTPGNLTVSYEKRQPFAVFEEGEVLAVDANFLEVFTFPALEGDNQTMLDQPNSVVLTETTRKRYFGENEAMGELLWIGEREQKKAYRITGILDDVPGNSHIEFDMLISMSSIPRVADQNWSWIWTTFVTFAVLNEQADPAQINLANRLENVPRKHAGVSLKRLQNVTFEEWEADGKEWKLYGQPLLDIHLNSAGVYSRLNSVNDILTIYIFGTIGLLIFIMCLINFINLTTARSFKRAKEIGIRKVVGSSRNNLIFQFLAESILISCIAILLGVILTQWLMPFFNVLSGKTMTLNLFERPMLLAILFVAPFITGILAGFYPALVMTAFSTIKSLKNKTGDFSVKGNLRNVLVVLQFTVSIVFIASTIVVFNQLQYQRNLDLGFEKDNKLIINRVDRLDASMESFRNELMEMRNV